MIVVVVTVLNEREEQVVKATEEAAKTLQLGVAEANKQNEMGEDKLVDQDRKPRAEVGRIERDVGELDEIDSGGLAA